MKDPATARLLPRNYLQILEDRVAFLEQNLAQYRPDLATDHLKTGRSKRSTQPDGLEEINHEDIDHGRDSIDDSWTSQHDSLDALASKVGLLSLNAAGAEPHYLGSSSTFAFSRLISSSLRQCVSIDNRPAFDAISRPDQDQTSLLQPCMLPDYDTAVKLSNAYFSNVHPQYPFLHEPTIKAWEASLIGGQYQFALDLDSPAPSFFLTMVGHIQFRSVASFDSMTGVRCWRFAPAKHGRFS